MAFRMLVEYDLTGTMFSRALPTLKLRRWENGLTVHVSRISSTLRHGTESRTKWCAREL